VSRPHTDLGRLQRWMQSAITHPASVLAGLEADETRQHLDVPLDDLESVVTRSQALTAAERLAIYSTAYHLRLLECLREEFAVLRQTLDDEIFDSFAFDYLRAYPPSSYTLNHLGALFPRFLAESRPPREPDAETPDWADCLIELALLERTFGEVFDGPGVEGLPLLEAAAFAAVAPERWPEARLIAVPCLRLLSFRFPVADHFMAVRRGDNSALPEPIDTFLAVTRRKYVVRHVALTRPEYTLLKSLVEGATIFEAIRIVTEDQELDVEDLASRLREWFHDWARSGFFLRVEFGEQGVAPP
jgi:hypothetical protein